jgi:tetrahydromethanopterin S-methyltransferase subunit F
VKPLTQASAAASISSINYAHNNFVAALEQVKSLLIGDSQRQLVSGVAVGLIALGLVVAITLGIVDYTKQAKLEAAFDASKNDLEAKAVESGRQSGMPIGAIAGIAAGGLAVLVLIVVVIVVAVRK